MTSLISNARKRFHRDLLAGVLTASKGVPSNADSGSKTSIRIAQQIAEQIGKLRSKSKASGQTAGREFEELVEAFLAATFPLLKHLRPGRWLISRTGTAIANFDQYAHLTVLSRLAAENADIAAAIGSDYVISPDVVIARCTEPDETINENAVIVDDKSVLLSSLRRRNNPHAILHASISCKWTLRSDRAQNSRTEALNLVRNRKGRLPHVIVVTGEPSPGRLASLALGTGDIDCVYHFALPELQAALARLEYEDAAELLQSMVDGRRIRDIGDLPLDLAV